jgi:hypothetical protein
MGEIEEGDGRGLFTTWNVKSTISIVMDTSISTFKVIGLYNTVSAIHADF